MFLGDSVNNRILIHSPNGEFLRSVPVGEFNISDLAVDESGNILVYDHGRRTIAEFDATGNLLDKLAVDPAAVEILGYIHITGSSVYFANAANKDVIVTHPILITCNEKPRVVSRLGCRGPAFQRGWS